jgi:hypothetical protein
MPRRVTVKTKELGQLDVLLVREAEGRWEPEWEPLRETVIGGLATQVPRGVVETALLGYSWPLVQQLGLAPAGALRKLPPEARVCSQRRTCGLWRAEDCHVRAKGMPWCFQPDTLPLKAAEVIQLWREGVYLIVTLEDNPCPTP